MREGPQCWFRFSTFSNLGVGWLVSAHPFLSLLETASRQRFALDVNNGRREERTPHDTRQADIHDVLSLLSVVCRCWELVSSSSRLCRVFIHQVYFYFPSFCLSQTGTTQYSLLSVIWQLVACMRESLTGKSCFIHREKVVIAAFLTINLLDLFCVINSLLDPASSTVVNCHTF